MERTGHGSLEGVRTYKRTSDVQREALSDILNSKKPRVDGNTSAVAVPVYPSTSHNPDREPPLLPVMNAANVQTTTKNCIPGAFYFNSCSSLTINMHCNESNLLLHTCTVHYSCIRKCTLTLIHIIIIMVL